MFPQKILLSPSTAQTLYDRRYRNIIDFEITSDLSKIVVCYDNFVIIWETATNYKSTEIQPTMKEITCIAISTDNSLFAVGGRSPRIIQIFTIRDKNSIILRYPFTTVVSITFREPFYLFTYSIDYTFGIWNLKQQSLIKSIKLSDKCFFLSEMLNVSTTIRQLIIADYTKLKIFNEKQEIQIFDNILTQITEKSCNILSWHKRLIRSKKNVRNIIYAKFIKDNKLLYIKFDNQSVIIFETATMRVISSIINEYAYQQIKVVFARNTVMIIGFNIFGLKYWVL